MLIDTVDDYMEKLHPWEKWDHSAKSVFCLMFLPMLISESDIKGVAEARFVNVLIFGNYSRRPPEFVISYFNRMPVATRSSIYPHSKLLRQSILKKSPRPPNWPSVL